LALAVAIALAATFPASLRSVEPPQSGTDQTPKIHPFDPHRLAIGGATWTLAGYYPSVGAFTTDRDDYTLYQRMIDAMADRGINYFRIAMTMGQPYGNSMNPYLRTGPGHAQDGRPKFDLTQFDQSYFDYWRRVVEHARNRGVVIQICMFDSWHARDEVVESNGESLIWGLKYDYYFHANNVNGLHVSRTTDLYDPGNTVFEYQQALIRKMIDTLGDLPNIVWEIANESGQTPWEILHADYVTSYERSRQFHQHLVMPRDLPGHQYVPGQCDNTPSVVHAELVNAFAQNRVLISDNDCTDAGSPNIRRGKAWAALTAGAQINLFHFELTSDEVLASQDAVDGMRYVGFQRKFVSDLGIDLAGMRPYDNEVSNGWALGNYGSEYIVYLPNGGSTSIYSLASTSRAVWFDPRSGISFNAGPGTNFTAPDTNDWVLYVRR
jgi:hypothetical protein